MNNTIKEPVRIRQKKLGNGCVSLYLDIYRNGNRSYEFLKLYLIPEKTKQDRETNRQTMQLANSIKAKRIVEIQNGEYGFSPSDKRDVMFFPYFKAMCEGKGGEGKRSTSAPWQACYLHLKEYEKNENMKFSQMTAEWVRGFRNYLDKKATPWLFDAERNGKPGCLSPNTKKLYYSKLKACLNRAVGDGIILKSPADGVEGFQDKEVTRMYLTIDEIRRLADTECRHLTVKTAFLFSCLTGLRRSDVERLTWGDVHQQGEFARIIFSQRKTGGLEYLDITQQAAELMGERKADNALVFPKLYSVSYTNDILEEWARSAGIDKKITFHSGRHTFATMMLDLGTDIYTVSKLLGHRELSTTQIYAKVMDKNKQKAVANIPDILHRGK